MKVVVFGATGKAGRAVALTLLAAGHQVTAFGRNPAKLPAHQGDFRDRGRCPERRRCGARRGRSGRGGGQPGRFRQPRCSCGWGPNATTPPNICEVGTANVIAAMAAASVRRLVCITSYGVGDTRDRLSPLYRLWFRVLQLGEQLADKERQEQLVKASGLDWTLIQPVGLTDGAATGRWLASPTGDRRKRTVSRVDLADFIADSRDWWPPRAGDGRVVRADHSGTRICGAGVLISPVCSPVVR